MKEERKKQKAFHIPLVGFPCINVLNLVAKVCDMTISEETVMTKFPQLFSGLGQLQDEQEIKLNNDATQFALLTPRQIPLQLMDQVKAELTKMENQQIISKVEGPTNWCSGMVVVPKPNKKVCICVDLTNLCKCVRRERHILPFVDHTLASCVIIKCSAN